jgi:hypothetical protein
MRLMVTLDDILYPDLAVNFVVEILTPVCDCTLLDWDLPSAQNFPTTVLKIPSDEFTIDMATVNEVSKSASPKIRACYVDGGPSCDETTVMTDVIEVGDIFPTQFYRQAFTNVIQINAADNTQAREYTLQVTHNTVDEGDLTYQTVTVVIGLCVITHIDPPTAPTASTYIIFSGASTYSMTPDFTQVPACGYDIQHTISWTLPTVDPDTLWTVFTGSSFLESAPEATHYDLQVDSTSGLTHHQTYTIVATDSVQYQEQAFAPSLTFTVDVQDPCRTATIETLVLADMTVILGETEIQYFD